MPGTTPDVETVTFRAASRGAPSSVSRPIAASTASRLSIGSPMPMKTTLRGGDPAGAAARATRYCRTISPAVSWRVKPRVAVAQNRHWRVQPAWLETHTVLRPAAGDEHGLHRRPGEIERDLDRAVGRLAARR